MPKPTKISGGETHAQDLAQDVCCPNCEYNLRGLQGAVVICPECGASCDIAQLVSRKWDKPWYKAPHFNTLLYPAAWAYIVFIVGTFGYALLLQFIGGYGAGLLIGSIAVSVWCLLMFRTWLVFQRAAGPLLAILAHALVTVYLVGVIGLLMSIAAAGHYVWQIATLSRIQPTLSVVVYACLLTVLCGVALWICRRCEKYMAHYCIKHYLNRTPTE